MTYKPDVADVRESPALEIIDELAAAGARVAFADPLMPSLVTPHAGGCISHQNPGGDIWNLVLVHTRHAECRSRLAGQASIVLDTTYRNG